MIDGLLSEENRMLRDTFRQSAERGIVPHVKTSEKEGKYRPPMT